MHHETCLKPKIYEGQAWAYSTPTPAYDELRSHVASLSPDARHELAGLMWFGRGDDMGDNLADCSIPRYGLPARATSQTKVVRWRGICAVRATGAHWASLCRP
jgi:hypothetical protein